MRLRSVLMVVVTVAFCASLIGCGGSKPPASTKAGDVPDWFLEVQKSPNYFFGTATAAACDLQMAIDMASNAARANIAQSVELKISGMIKSFQEQVGTDENAEYLQQFTQATKTVFSTQLSGTTVLKKNIQKDGSNYRAYVLVEYPIGAVNQALQQQLQSQQNLYTRFQNSKAHEELDKEVEEYEAWKDKLKDAQ